MGWERRRNGRQYYYRVQRVGERVVKTYVGGGAKGREAAEKDAAELQSRGRAKRQRAELCQEELASLLDEFDHLVEKLVACQLLSSGWRQHHREWRPSANGYPKRNSRTA